MTDLALKQETKGMPREVLIFAAVLIAVVIIGAGTARLTGFGRAAPPVAEAVQSVSLRFEDQEDGSVLVRRGNDGALIYRVAPETNGFMRQTLRGLVRDRRRSGLGDETPFVLTYWKDGRLTLDDPAIDRRLELEFFGHTNAGAFALLLQASGGLR